MTKIFRERGRDWLRLNRRGSVRFGFVEKCDFPYYYKT